MDKGVHTVTGLRSPKEMGHTQCHEHIMISKGHSAAVNPALCIDDEELSLKEVLAYKRSGGAALVDAQPVGCGRDAEALLHISRKSGVDIIASTGFHKLMFYPEEHWIRSCDTSSLTELFIKELTEGMYVGSDYVRPEEMSGIRAGIIKTALDRCGLDGQYRALFEAAAAAQVRTSAPLMVHIEKGSSPCALARYLMKSGVDPEKTYFCHMDRACPDTDKIYRILDYGITLEFDTIGRFKYHSDDREAALIMEVLDHGAADRLLISLDTTRERLKAYNEDAVGLDHILRCFIPLLKKNGVDDGTIEKITVENPRRILAW